MRRFTTLLIGCLLSLSAAAVSRAGDQVDDQAKQAFSEGAEFFSAGDYVAAAEAFRRAYGLNPSWKIQYNIGQSEAACKRHGLALEAFEKYLSQGGDDIPEDRRAEVLKSVEELRQIVGTLEFNGEAGVDIYVDDMQRGTTPLPGRVKVAAGTEHLVEARRGDEVVLSRRVTVGGGENLIIGIAAADEKGAGTTTEQETVVEVVPPVVVQTDAEDHGRPLRVAGWVLLGTGAAIAGGGAVMGGLALKKNDDLVAACGDVPPGAGCTAQKRDSRDTFSTVSTILLGAGAAVAVTGLVLVIVGVKKGRSEQAVSMTPLSGPGFAGAALTGRF